MEAEPIYEAFVSSCREVLGDEMVATGEFGAMMHLVTWSCCDDVTAPAMAYNYIYIYMHMILQTYDIYIDVYVIYIYI